MVRRRYCLCIGYDLHITRADFYADASETPITPDEWKSFVDATPDLEFRPEATFYSDAEADVAVWTGHPDPEFDAWLAYFEGEVHTKYPDEPFIARMFEIAAALGARLQGDEGELYGRDGRVLPDHEQVALIAEREVGAREAAQRRSLLARFLRRR